MADVSRLYDELLRQKGGDYGEVFNLSESARAGKPIPGLSNLAPEELVQFNRIAQSADVPATAILAAPYEAMKGFEQSSGIPLLTGAAGVLNKIGVPVAPPKPKGGNTSPASFGNVLASLRGVRKRLGGMFR